MVWALELLQLELCLRWEYVRAASIVIGMLWNQNITPAIRQSTKILNAFCSYGYFYKILTTRGFPFNLNIA